MSAIAQGGPSSLMPVGASEASAANETASPVLFDFANPGAIAGNTELAINRFYKGMMQAMGKVFNRAGGQWLNIDSHPVLGPLLEQKARETGGNAIQTTACLLGTMSGAMTSSSELERAFVALSQHGYELFPDEHSEKYGNHPRWSAGVRQFNQLASSIARGEGGLDVTAAFDEQFLSQLPPRYRRGMLIGKLLGPLANLLPGARTGAENKPIWHLSKGDMLAIDLQAIANIREFTAEVATNPQIAQLAVEGLASRYEGVQRTIDTGYGRMTWMEAADTRRQSILITTTMATLASVASKTDQDTKAFLNNEENATQTVEAIRTAAEVIGLYNDLGTGIIDLPEEELIAYSRALSKMPNPREFFGQKGELIFEGITFDRNMFAQLIKDAKENQANVWLDRGAKRMTEDMAVDGFTGEEIPTGTDTDLAIVVAYIKSLEMKVGALTATMPLALERVIQGAVIFHRQLYSGHDYYSKESAALQLPIVRGKVRLEEMHIMGYPGLDQTEAA